MKITDKNEKAFRILLSHRPEVFEVYSDFGIDLALTGHAHGGQIRIGGQGIYAPGQGLLPRLTRGVVDDKMIISTGAGNPARMPRWGNPCEVLLIRMD